MTATADPGGARSRRRARAALTALLVLVPPSMAALYPLVFIVRSHSTTHLLGPEVILRPALALIVSAAVVALCFKAALRTALRASTAATLFFVLLGLFPVLFNVKGPYTSAVLPLGFGIVSAMLAFTVARTLDRSLSLIINGAVSACVAAIAISTMVVSAAVWPEPKWRVLVDQMIDRPRAVGLADVQRPPDIYYLVLDGMGRADVLERLYGVRVGEALASLASSGVQLPPRARSNYAQTQLSLASALNMQYLSELTSVMGDALDRRPVNRLITNAGVVKLLKRYGYEIVVVGPLSTITAQNVDIDRCLCSLPDGPTELEYSLLSITPARGGYLDRAGIAAHGRQVRRAFDQIETVSSARPMFVISHIVSPHPPFALAGDGSIRATADRFTYHDGDGYPGSRAEYVAGYSAQAVYVLDRTVRLVKNLIDRTPHSVIVIHGDHGPGLGLVNTDVFRTDSWERLAIFSAYYSGGRSLDVPEDMSPVNALRWAVNAGLGGSLELLPNRSYLSSYSQPYRWIEVPPALAPRQSDVDTSD